MDNSTINSENNINQNEDSNNVIVEQKPQKVRDGQGFRLHVVILTVVCIGWLVIAYFASLLLGLAFGSGANPAAIAIYIGGKILLCGPPILVWIFRFMKLRKEYNTYKKQVQMGEIVKQKKDIVENSDVVLIIIAVLMLLGLIFR